jgi:hypothetical protein
MTSPRQTKLVISLIAASLAALGASTQAPGAEAGAALSLKAPVPASLGPVKTPSLPELPLPHPSLPLPTVPAGVAETPSLPKLPRPHPSLPLPTVPAPVAETPSLPKLPRPHPSLPLPSAPAPLHPVSPPHGVLPPPVPGPITIHRAVPPSVQSPAAGGGQGSSPQAAGHASGGESSGPTGAGSTASVRRGHEASPSWWTDRARAAGLQLSAPKSSSVPPVSGGPPSGGASAGAIGTTSTVHYASPPAKRAHAGSPGSSGAKDLLGLHLSAATGQAMMVALLALAAMGLLALLFTDELQLVLSRLIQRRPS